MREPGASVLRRIIAAGGRLRQDTFNDGMLLDAATYARSIRPLLDESDQPRVDQIVNRITTVIAARRRARDR